MYTSGDLRPQRTAFIHLPFPIIAALCCWLVAIGINYGTRYLYPPAIEEELQFIPQQKVIESLSLDHKGFAADLLFIQTLMHTGSLTWKPDRFRFNDEWAYRMIDLVTELDPKYYSAYLFSGMGLIHTHDDIYRANTIIKKGMKIFPDSWELPFWIGFNAYLYLENDAMASKYLLMAAKKPKAPVSFFSLLLSAITRGGNFQDGIWVLESMIKNEKNPNIRLVYKKRITRMQNFIDLQKAADLYKLRKKMYPKTLHDLIDAGIIKNIPRDPMGKAYFWNRTTHRVECRKQGGEKSQ